MIILTATTGDEADVRYQALTAELTTAQHLLYSVSHCWPTRERFQEIQQRISHALQITATYLLNYSAALANNTARFTDLFGRIGLIMHTFFQWIKDPGVLSIAGPSLFAIPFSVAAASRVAEVILTPTSNAGIIASAQSRTSMVIVNSAVGISMIAWIVAAIELLSSSLFKNDTSLKITTATFTIAASRNLLIALLKFIDSFESIKTSALHLLLTKILATLNSMLAQGLTNIAIGASVVATAILTFIDIFYNGPRPASENYDPTTLAIVGFAIGGIAGLLSVLLKNIAPATAQTLQTIFAMFHSTFGSANIIVLGTALTNPEIATGAGFAAQEVAMNASFISLTLFSALGNILRGYRRYHQSPENPIQMKFQLPNHYDYVPVTAKSFKAKVSGNICWIISVLLYIIGWGVFLLTGFNEALTEPIRSTRTITREIETHLMLESPLELPQ